MSTVMLALALAVVIVFLAGKTLIPFITHGGYGLGSSESVIARHAPKARLRRAFSMQADQERQTMDRVNAWLTE